MTVRPSKLYAAWEDAQGVWYRRGGWWHLLRVTRVKAITGRAAPETFVGN